MTKQSTDSIFQTLQAMLDRAYSPYSQVKVAAAVVFTLDDKSEIAYGVNVENVSYGLTNCAERSAISAAIAMGMKYIDAVYLVSNQSSPITPCGGCRQVLSEFMYKQEAPVVCKNADLSDRWSCKIADLLPNRFDL